MAIVEAHQQLIIKRSAIEVYEFLADGLNNTAWRPTVQQIELKSGEAAQLGAVYRQVLSGPGGRAIDGDYQITIAEPGRELGFQVIAGPARPTGSYTLTAVPDGTKLDFSLQLAPKGLMKLMRSMIQKTMESEVAQLLTLKAALEAKP